MWVKSYHWRQMQEYISESVVARRFLDLTAESMMHIRDHASLARAEAAVGAEGKAPVNALIINTAPALGLTNGEILSSDTTVPEPLIGYPNEPGSLNGWAGADRTSLEEASAAPPSRGRRRGSSQPRRFISASSRIIGWPRRQPGGRSCSSRSSARAAS
jgi:hypothetical protein